MDRNDQQAIEGIFERLAEVERTAPPRDGEAEAFINERVALQPAAPYFMAQTIVAQQAALTAAQARIAEFEAAQNRGGFLGNLFGGVQRGGAPFTSRRPAQPHGQGAAGGGFLAGAAQTAIGVTGGVLLGNALAGMFGAGAAQAGAPEEPGADAFGDAGGFEDIEF